MCQFPKYLAKTFVATILLAYSQIVLSETTVKQNTQGNCSPTTVTSPGSTTAPITVVDCRSIIISKSDKRLNQLEQAQYRLLLAKNTVRLSAEAFFFAKPLVEPSTSLWASVKNPSEFDVENLEITPRFSLEKKSQGAKTQAYISDMFPDSVSRSKNVLLFGRTQLALKAADSNQLKSLLPDPKSDWCLYDISERAEDSDINGYAEASNNLLRDPNSQASYRTTKSIPITFEISYQDIFKRHFSFPTVRFLRFANTKGFGEIFYPSKADYDELACVPL